MNPVLLDHPLTKQGYLRRRCASDPIPIAPPAEIDGLADWQPASA